MTKKKKKSPCQCLPEFSGYGNSIYGIIPQSTNKKECMSISLAMSLGLCGCVSSILL